MATESASKKSEFPIAPPIEPMLAKLAEALPPEGGYLYEPKWDGFRAIVFRGADDVYIQSRDSRPLDRYFPELHDALLTNPFHPDGMARDLDRALRMPLEERVERHTKLDAAVRRTTAVTWAEEFLAALGACR